MKIRRIPILAGLAVAFACASAFAAAPEIVSGLSAARYLQDVWYLSRDEMKGRGDGTPELDQAADYIAAEFRKAGLQPAGENGSYFQNFDVTTGAVLGPKNSLEIAGRTLKIDDDFVPIVFSDTAEFEGPLVFAGYGITAPEYKYDDYAGIDVTNKIVVVLRFEPQETDEKSVFAGKDLTPHASLVNKAINARLHGAKGIIFVTGPLNHDYEEVGPVARREQYGDLGIPAVHATRAAISAALGGKDLADIQRAIDANLQAQSFDVMGVSARIATDVERTRKSVKNVVAMLPGSDAALKSEYVVLGAHYDHLGLGDRNSLAPSQIGQVHHGADDNASGTAGVMELARAAQTDKPRWKRSVLFMAFAGEEIGLLGSSWYANHPTVPADKIDAMLNMDMIGRMSKDRLFVGGVGTSPDYKPMIDQFGKNSGLDIEVTESGYGSSDHTSFNVKKIPVLFFFSGLHTDYHKPSDTYDKINAQGAIEVLSLVYRITDRLAAETKKIAYNEVLTAQPAGRASGGGYGPYFGSIPDFRDDIKGVLFAAVQDNSPAAKAGLKAGDTMTSFDGKTILTLNDYAYALRLKKPGDVVPVTVKRGNGEIKVDVTLEARK
jgi:peptidase M28-like protein/PDZ domain-containing protein/PA domain-containing protein